MQQTITLPGELLRTGEAAKRLGVGVTRLWTLSKVGEVKYLEVAGVRLYSIEELDRYAHLRDERRKK